MLQKNPPDGGNTATTESGGPANQPVSPSTEKTVQSTVIANRPSELLERAELLRVQLRRESLAMSAYALTIGRRMPQETASKLNLLDENFGSAPIDQLVQLHSELAELIAPALPGSVSHLYQHAARAKFQHRLAPVPVARWMAIVGLVFVVIILASASLRRSMTKTLTGACCRTPAGTYCWCSCSCCRRQETGACFANLFDILKSVNAMTILPTFSSEYWVKLALGVIAGLLLAELIPITAMPVDGAAAKGVVADGEGSMQKPVVALLGGFSASILYTILNWLTETMENLFGQNRRRTRERAVRPGIA